MGRLPDRERGWLRSGSRGIEWPPMVKDRLNDYADAEQQPRRSLNRRDMAELDALFLGEGCLASAVPADRMALVALVLRMKAWPEKGGFRWEPVFDIMRRAGVKASVDALRTRYERCLGLMLAAMTSRDQARLSAGLSIGA